jgi:hypothetical protein
MSTDLLPEDFWGMPLAQRVAKCREMAAQAERLALHASGETRDGYLKLVREWIALADEIQRWHAGRAPLQPRRVQHDGETGDEEPT